MPDWQSEKLSGCGLMGPNGQSSAGDLMIKRFINTFLPQCYICIVSSRVTAERKCSS